MALYALISPNDNPALEQAIAEKFKNKFYKIAPGQFVISADNITTQQVAEQLDISSGKFGFVLILPISNYFGWHRRDLWEWLAAQSKASAT